MSGTAKQQLRRGYRLPITVGITAVLTAWAASSWPALAYAIAHPPDGWLNVPIVAFALSFCAVTPFTQLAGAYASLDETDASGIPPAAQLRLRTGQVRRRHTATLAALGLLTLTSTIAFSGERSPSWATSRPRSERDVETADGHVFWIDQVPVQSDSSFFAFDVDALSGVRRYSEIQLPGRSAYSFVVNLLLPIAKRLGSSYSAFLAVNALSWWAATAVSYAIACHVQRSWAVAIGAALLTATGLGFVFAAGLAMSTVSAYAIVIVILALVIALEPFAGAAMRRGDVLLMGVLTGAAALTYPVGPFIVAVSWLQLKRRDVLLPFAAWTLLVLGTGSVWGHLVAVNSWTLPVRAALRRVIQAGTPVALATGALSALAFASEQLRWGPAARRRIAGLAPGAWSQRTVRSSVTWVCIALVATAGALTVMGFRPAALGLWRAAVQSAAVLTAGVPLLDRILPAMAAAGFTPSTVTNTIVKSGLDRDLAAAFPLPVLLTAAIGTWRLPRQWVEWSLSLLVVAVLVDLVYGMTTGSAHPRLVYLAYPGVYLLAAAGLGALTQAATSFSRLVSLPARLGIALAAAPYVAALGPVVYASTASLWGDWSFAARFHGFSP